MEIDHTDELKGLTLGNQNKIRAQKHIQGDNAFFLKGHLHP